MNYSTMSMLSRYVVAAAHTKQAANGPLAEVLQGAPDVQPPLASECRTLCRGVVDGSTPIQPGL